MKIAVVHGAFLPVPPIRGGAGVRVWHRLSILLAARGHEVLSLSRTWPGWPHRESLDGVQHLRLQGRDHYRSLPMNLWLDWRWSRRVRRALPPDAWVISQNIFLPALLTLGPHPHPRPVTVVIGRMPKGQTALYGRVSRIYATSRAVATACGIRLADRVRVLPNPIDTARFRPSPPSELSPSPRPRLRIGYVGRIHPEKGLDLLVAAAAHLHANPDLPEWEIALIGPTDIPLGGGGPGYLHALRQSIARLHLDSRISFHPPTWDLDELATFYRTCDVFVYPSLAEKGETFGVAPLEAMACGTAVVLSSLPCFAEYLRPDINGLVFDHRHPDAPRHLAERLAALIIDPAYRRSLSLKAAEDARRFDYINVVQNLEDDLLNLDPAVRP